MRIDLQKFGGRGSGSRSNNSNRFSAGATPRDIPLNGTYKVTKMNNSGNSDFGNLSGADTRDVLKGYHFNGLFWEKNNNKTIYEVRRVN